MQAFYWLIGLENVTRIDTMTPSLGSAWARSGLFWVVLASIALFVLSIVFYVRLQPRGSLATRIGLGACRGVLLVLLLVTLANPLLRVGVQSTPRPLVYVLFDGTESMTIQDELPAHERARLAAAAGLPESADGNAARPSRVEYVQAMLTRDRDNFLRQLQTERDCRVEAFVFEGNNTNQLRKLDLSASGGQDIDPAHVARQLSTRGQVTAIGTVIHDLGRQYHSGNLAGVIVVSDFAQNSGLAPVGSAAGAESPVARLGAPIYTVGVGATEALDLDVRVQPPPKMKRAERATVGVRVGQTGLEGQTVTVRLRAVRLQGSAVGPDRASDVPIGEKTVTITSPVEYVPFDYTPQEAGRFQFVAEVDPVPGEVVSQNNRSEREVNIIDDHLRLMYVAYEPNWEWRFVKEVFHRDKLVGMEGFRTFLRSADPKVRQTNELFLPTLTPKRSEFFANDVIFLGDMPAAAISQRFGEMAQEFVGKFGGGLVVIAGPRFGPGELANTPLRDMLPVVVDPSLRIRDQREFTVEVTPAAPRYEFMRLGQAESRPDLHASWNRLLGPLPWYQPVARLTDQAEALMVHPVDTCANTDKKQPLVAIRPYGRGEVVYVAFDEMWRLRRKYGEEYYRQFWSQLIYRLGMSRALGAQKRFVLRTDRPNYQVEDKVTLIVEAYDGNFEPLSEEKIPERQLMAELTVPGRQGTADQTRSVPISQLREGEFEVRFPVLAAGEYRVRVKDPVTDSYVEERFQVADLSAERRSGIRNKTLQDAIAQESRGRSYDLADVSKLVNELDLDRRPEVRTHNNALWSTPLWFIAVVGLMLGEWFFRKMVNLI
jgi:hypothetical protein